jgi:hypothetical protein
MAHRTWLILLGLAAACGGRVRSVETAAELVIRQPPDEWLLDLVQAALSADARLEPAGSLYAEEATTVANGVARQLPPRYAGLAPGGDVAIITSRVVVREQLAWVMVEYRWVSTAEGAAREGVATFVMTPAEPGGAGWRIVHAHSSSPPSP